MMDQKSDHKIRRERRMQQIDNLTPELRAVVNEWGWTIVDNFMRCGVKKANRIEHLINVVLNETRAPRGYSASFQGPRRGTDHAEGSDLVNPRSSAAD
ncbi:MAG TPA: hypothetical protein VHE81_15185 [Lacipirellulaceae bacterium]|nr:hypothetical protein [Lacipirellulaceae bacterium]